MKVTVIGGGVVGLCCAFSLSRGGADVTLLERDRCGHGCSFGNTGWVCPGLSAPLPAPGVMSAALRGMVKPGSPLLIRPLFGPSFLRWSWLFWRSCTPERYRRGTEATLALGRDAPELYDELRASGVEFELHATGMVIAALTDAGLVEYTTMVRDAQDAGYDEPVEILDRERIREVEPAASDAVVGGVHAPSELYVRPESISRGLAEALRAGGAAVREETEVRDIRPVAGRWRVETSDGEEAADAVVVAAGVWSARLLAKLGIRIPMEAAKGYSVTARGTGTLPRHAFYLAEAKVGCSTFGDALRIAGIFDLTGLDTTLRRRRVETIVRSSVPYLRDWRPVDVELEWTGLRPYPPDGLPIIGAVPGYDGLYVATGHGRMGITLAPPTGEVIRSLVLDGKAQPELEPFAVERFARRSPVRARARTRDSTP